MHLFGRRQQNLISIMKPDELGWSAPSELERTPKSSSGQFIKRMVGPDFQRSREMASTPWGLGPPSSWWTDLMNPLRPFLLNWPSLRVRPTQFILNVLAPPQCPWQDSSKALVGPPDRTWSWCPNGVFVQTQFENGHFFQNSFERTLFSNLFEKTPQTILRPTFKIATEPFFQSFTIYKGRKSLVCGWLPPSPQTARQREAPPSDTYFKRQLTHLARNAATIKGTLPYRGRYFCATDSILRYK